MRLLQLESGLRGVPFFRATYETDIPSSLFSRTARSLSAIENRRRRWASVLTEIASISLLRHSQKPSRMTRRYQKSPCPVETGAAPICQLVVRKLAGTAQRGCRINFISCPSNSWQTERR